MCLHSAACVLPAKGHYAWCVRRRDTGFHTKSAERDRHDDFK